MEMKIHVLTIEMIKERSGGAHKELILENKTCI